MASTRRCMAVTLLMALAAVATISPDLAAARKPDPGSPTPKRASRRTAGQLRFAEEPVAGAYVPVPLTRVVDILTGPGGATPARRSSVDLQLTGRGGVPADGVSAVMLNVTAADPKGTGHLSVYPTGATPTRSSTLKFNPGAGRGERRSGQGRGRWSATIANRSDADTPVVVDVVGYSIAGTPTAIGA